MIFWENHQFCFKSTLITGRREGGLLLCGMEGNRERESARPLKVKTSRIKTVHCLPEARCYGVASAVASVDNPSVRHTTTSSADDHNIINQQSALTSLHMHYYSHHTLTHSFAVPLPKTGTSSFSHLTRMVQGPSVLLNDFYNSIAQLAW